MHCRNGSVIATITFERSSAIILNTSSLPNAIDLRKLQFYTTQIFVLLLVHEIYCLCMQMLNIEYFFSVGFIA